MLYFISIRKCGKLKNSFTTIICLPANYFALNTVGLCRYDEGYMNQYQSEPTYSQNSVTAAEALRSEVFISYHGIFLT